MPLLIPRLTITLAVVVVLPIIWTPFEEFSCPFTSFYLFDYDLYRLVFVEAKSYGVSFYIVTESKDVMLNEFFEGRFTLRLELGGYWYLEENYHLILLKEMQVFDWTIVIFLDLLDLEILFNSSFLVYWDQILLQWEVIFLLFFLLIFFFLFIIVLLDVFYMLLLLFFVFIFFFILNHFILLIFTKEDVDVIFKLFFFFLLLSIIFIFYSSMIITFIFLIQISSILENELYSLPLLHKNKTFLILMI